jgi:hypothetical protein
MNKRLNLDFLDSIKRVSLMNITFIHLFMHLMKLNKVSTVIFERFVLANSTIIENQERKKKK